MPRLTYKPRVINPRIPRVLRSVSLGFPKLSYVVGYWKLDEESGNRVDATGNGHTFVANGTIPTATGKLGLCCDYEADAAEYLEIANPACAPFKPGASAFSVQAWVNWDDVATLFRPAFCLYDATNNRRAWAIMLNTGSYIGFHLSADGSARTVADSNAVASASQWYHIVGVWNTSNVLLYINGVLQTDQPAFAGPVYAGYPLRSGVYNGNAGIDAQVDELCYWSTTLSGEDVKVLYNGGAGLSYP